MITQLANKHSEKLRFLLVGSLGFAVNFVALFVLHGRLGLHIIPAQLLASELSLLSNFFLHHKWTYRGYHEKPFLHRILHFHAVAWLGALIGSSGLWLGVGIFKLHYLVALAGGAGVAMVWNYLLNKYVIWAKAAGDE